VTERRPAGIFPPIPTPFDPATGDVAPRPFRENIARLLAEGVAGIVVSGSTGEAPLLDADEQRHLVGLAREALSDDLWLIAGTGAESTGRRSRSPRPRPPPAPRRAGRPPSYFSAAATPESLAIHFRAVADASPVPVLIYTSPSTRISRSRRRSCSSSRTTSGSSASRIRRVI